METYEYRYNKIYNWFQKGRRLLILKFLYKFLPFATAFLYLCVIATVFFKGDFVTGLKITILPAVGFIIVTVFRKFINAKRPYTKYNITPLINKDKTGESFPSRHTFSITIISMAVLYVNIYLGIILWIMALILATTRVLAGVHFIKDVAGATIISILMGGLLWLI